MRPTVKPLRDRVIGVRAEISLHLHVRLLRLVKWVEWRSATRVTAAMADIRARNVRDRAEGSR